MLHARNPVLGERVKSAKVGSGVTTLTGCGVGNGVGNGDGNGVGSGVGGGDGGAVTMADGTPAG